MAREARRSEKKTEWARVDATTDEDTARQIAEDPDAAPDLSEALERGELVRLNIVDLFGIRTRMGLSHDAFAERFGLDPDAVRDGPRVAAAKLRSSRRARA